MFTSFDLIEPLVADRQSALRRAASTRRAGRAGRGERRTPSLLKRGARGA